ncbi:MAG: hypothetical protein WC390_07935 [Sulfurimonas sp.]|jgi:hypothetical protein
MTIEEINLQIAEIDKKIEILKSKKNHNLGGKQEQFKEIADLTVELSSAEKRYYDCRTLLGFAYPEELSEEDRIKVEMQMPILDEHIKTIRKKLEAINLK